MQIWLKKMVLDRIWIELLDPSLLPLRANVQQNFGWKKNQNMQNLAQQNGFVSTFLHKMMMAKGTANPNTYCWLARWFDWSRWVVICSSLAFGGHPSFNFICWRLGKTKVPTYLPTYHVILVLLWGHHIQYQAWVEMLPNSILNKHCKFVTPPGFVSLGSPLKETTYNLQHVARFYVASRAFCYQMMLRRSKSQAHYFGLEFWLWVWHNIFLTFFPRTPTYITQATHVCCC